AQRAPEQASSIDDHALGLAEHERMKALDLDEVLLHSKRAQQSLERISSGRTLHLAAQEREPRMDEGLRARDVCGQIVVRARVRDPLAEDLAVLVEEQGLRR